MEFIELQIDLDKNAKFVSKTFLQLYEVSPKNKISQRVQNWFGCLEVFIFANNSYLRPCNAARATIAARLCNSTTRQPI